MFTSFHLHPYSPYSVVQTITISHIFDRCSDCGIFLLYFFCSVSSTSVYNQFRFVLLWLRIKTPNHLFERYNVTNVWYSSAWTKKCIKKTIQFELPNGAIRGKNVSHSQNEHSQKRKNQFTFVPRFWLILTKLFIFMGDNKF